VTGRWFRNEMPAAATTDGIAFMSGISVMMCPSNHQSAIVSEVIAFAFCLLGAA
jgi:hypothetical protein